MIVKREKEIKTTGRTMLELAKAQGEDLIALKKMCPHGTFMEAVARTGLSQFQANQYMRVARDWGESVAAATISDSISAFLGRDRSSPRVAPQPFTRTDAEYALKIAALADRGVDGEQETAKVKLEGLAKTFGMDEEGLVQKAQKLCPEYGMTPRQANVLVLKEELLAPYRKMTKEQLIETIFDFVIQLSEAEDAGFPVRWAPAD